MYGVRAQHHSTFYTRPAASTHYMFQPVKYTILPSSHPSLPSPCLSPLPSSPLPSLLFPPLPSPLSTSLLSPALPAHPICTMKCSFSPVCTEEYTTRQFYTTNNPTQLQTNSRSLQSSYQNRTGPWGGHLIRQPHTKAAILPGY